MREDPSYREATDAEIVAYFENRFGGRRRLAYYFDHKTTFIGCGCCADSVQSCSVCDDPCTYDEDYATICDPCKKKGYYEDKDYTIKQMNPLIPLVKEALEDGNIRY